MTLAYIIGQYNHNSASMDDSSFITPITAGTVKRKEESSDSEISGLSPIFTNECISGLNLNTSNYYYFRCQVKRMTSSQTFSVKLITYDDDGINKIEQFIKQVTIRGGDREEWVSVELIFHPIVTFDTILFELQRTLEDYREASRYPKIDYQQLGIINNLIPDKCGTEQPLLKIGVQSRPSLVMCINGEEIHTSRSGVFEIRNGIIPVNFFSVVNAAQENTSAVDDWKTSINEQIEAIENSSMTVEQKEAAYANIQSRCFFGSSKKYAVDSFTLDYMYSNT
jgi:hypothetical protein